MDMSQEEARKRIRQAREKEASELDLSVSGLQQFPEELWELTNLTKLRVFDDGLTMLSPNIGNLPNLRVLCLDDEPLEEQLPGAAKTSRMRIEAHCGDIAKIAPQVLATQDPPNQSRGAGVLWIRDGFSSSASTWHFKIRPEWKPVGSPGPNEKPWLLGSDSLIKLQMPDTDLQYVYVFSTETSPRCHHGHSNSLESLADALLNCLARLAAEKIQRIAFMHMPFSGARCPTPEDKNRSARQMITTLRRWGKSQESKSNPVTHVYLISRPTPLQWLRQRF